MRHFGTDPDNLPVHVLDRVRQSGSRGVKAELRIAEIDLRGVKIDLRGVEIDVRGVESRLISEEKLVARRVNSLPFEEMATPAPKSHTEAEKFFDQIAQDYRARSEGQVYNVSSLSFARRQEVVSSLLAKTPEGGTVLDYGMGPAVFGPPAVARGLKYIGIDISQKMIDLAQEMNLPRAEYHRGDLSVLEQFQSAADTVLLIGLIDYLEHPTEGLRALAKCVKPGGRIILSFRNHRSFPRLLRNSCKAAYRAVRGESHEPGTAFAAPVLERSFVPQRDFVPTLKDEGFQEFEVRYLDASPIFWKMPLPKPLWHAWKKVDAIVSQPFLSGLCASGILMASAKK